MAFSRVTTLVDVRVNVSYSAMMLAPRQYSIGELCDEFAITARALRFYEDEQLIAPLRRGTQRLYSDKDRARLAWILRGKRVGFSLADIREMLDLYDLGDQRETQRLVTLEDAATASPRSSGSGSISTRPSPELATTSSPSSIHPRKTVHAQLHRSGPRHAVPARPCRWGSRNHANLPGFENAHRPTWSRRS